MELFKFLAILVGLVVTKEITADQPCVPKFYEQSAVCVCNNTYCDTITRTEPAPGTFMIYASSKAGLRFQKQRGVINSPKQTKNKDNNGKVFEIIPETSYQKIEGFGGASTDAAGINWKSLQLQAQQNLINSYFSDDGIEYNMLRLPIGGTDFSTRVYAYNEQPEYDLGLSNFTLSSEDYDFKIPLINAAKEVATDFIKIVSASWSPPAWMKDTKQMVGGSIKPEYFQVFADYLCKFAEEYKKNGIDIWAMTPSNEPLNSLFDVKFQSVLWSIGDMARFIKNYFGPTLKECSVKGIKILSGDDQRNNIPTYFTMLVLEEPNALQFVDGFAVHSYIDKAVPPSIATFTLQRFPDKFAISTEYCAGAANVDKLKVDLGSWDRAKDYFENISENLNSGFVGWIDWNLCLDTEGGPNWVENFVDSPIIVDADKQEFYKQPMFYALGHFSKFIPRGSKRIKILKIDDENFCQNEICVREPSKEYVAFLTPRKTIVVNIKNDGDKRSVVIRVSGHIVVKTVLEADSFTTLEIPYDIKSIKRNNKKTPPTTLEDN